LKNPVLVAAGTFGYGEEYSPLIDLNRLGGIITKTLTLRPCPGNPPPRLTETPAGLLNSIGLENPGVEVFIQEKLPFLQKLKTCIIVSIGGEREDEYLMIAEKLSKKEGIHALEVNVSCPNVESYSLGKEAKLVFSLVSKLKEVSDLPLIVKLAPDVTDIVEIAKAAVKGGAEALSLINTFPGMAIDTNTWRPKLGNVTGGLSGPAIKPIAVRLVWEVHQRLNVPLIGAGGIMNLEDALEFVLAGASAVAVGTANFVDPQTSIQIITQLENYLLEKKIEKFSRLIGQLKIEER
jgi:dihydroorotate dehydrogenase (NAD+) catalytic subunit